MSVGMDYYSVGLIWWQFATELKRFRRWRAAFFCVAKESKKSIEQRFNE